MRSLERPRAPGPGPGESLILAALLLCVVANMAHGQAIYALKPGDPNRDVSELDLRRDAVTGLTCRVRWEDVNPGERVYHFAEIDENLALCHRVGKPLKLLVQTGRDVAPRWIGGQWLEAEGKTAPAPWSPQLATHHGRLLAELGRRYAADPLVWYVHVTGPTWPSAEMHPMPGLENAAGYSDAAMIAAWSAAIDATAAAFPNQGLAISISVKTPTDRYVDDVLDYARQRVGQRLLAQHNSLKASTDVDAPHHVFILEQRAKGVRVAFENVCAAADEPWKFGSRDVNEGLKIGAEADAEFIDVYPPDLEAVR